MGYSLTQNYDGAAGTPPSDVLHAVDETAGVVDGDQQQMQLQQNNRVAQEQRRQEILKKGSIPEFVQIRNTMDFYQVYQEANHRNKLLVESQRQQQLQNFLNGEPVDQAKVQQ